ncbi:T9SS type A sorting domain-containing protein [bacterium]|nr:T9SS type A sorting domain-containing protein [bacterium]
MKKFYNAFVLSVLTSSVALAQLPTKVISGNITADRTLHNDTIYLLDAVVYVKNNATLTIEEGTVIQGYINNGVNTKGTLVITTSGKIMAQGTKWNPIVFTSAQTPGSRGTGDWGGLLILGLAPINVAGGTAIIEGGLLGDQADRTYGGTDPNHNSGVLSYVRLEYAGVAFSANNEINSLTMAGVGKGTTIDHIQVSFAGDDAYEWFGGNVDAKYLVAIGTVDDNFDCDFGYNGRVQYGLIKQYSNIADISTSEGWETDNDGGGSINTPLTAPKFANITLVGPQADGGAVSNLHGRGARIRRNSRTSIYNSVIMDHKIALRYESTGTQDAVGNDCEFHGNVLSGNTANYAGEGSWTEDSVAAYVEDAAQMNTVFDAGGISANELSVPLDYYSQTGTNHLPITGSILLSGADWTANGVSGDSFFDNVAFRGAFGTQDWTQFWTEFDPQTVDYGNGILSAVENEVVDFKLYPNPSNGLFSITLEETARVEILDLSGRFVWGRAYPAGISSIDATTWPKGVYVIRVSTAKGASSRRVVVR